MSSKPERSILGVLAHAGYSSSRKIADTLQGSIWSSTKRKNHQSVVVKVTSRKLHKESVMIHGGKKYKVEENIIKEKSILKILTINSAQNTYFVRYVDFFKSNTNYYFVMENGGRMLFDFVIRAHKYIAVGQLDIAEWHKVVKNIFLQILNAVQYIHYNNVSHFDISLENLLINEVEVTLHPNGKFTFCCDNISIKLCDFGLSEQFLSDNFTSTKYCGKRCYKSPECAKKQPFDAKKNDIWCVGVCLFVLLLGGTMDFQADDYEIINGNIDKCLKQWDRIQFVNDEIIDLFNKIFKYENKRVNIQQIKQHQWLSK